MEAFRAFCLVALATSRPTAGSQLDFQSCSDSESFCPHLCGLVLRMADSKACEHACRLRLPTIKAAVAEYCQGKFCVVPELDGNSLLQHRNLSKPSCDAREPYCERLCHGGLFQEEDPACRKTCVARFDILRKAYDSWCDVCRTPSGENESLAGEKAGEEAKSPTAA